MLEDAITRRDAIGFQHRGQSEIKAGGDRFAKFLLHFGGTANFSLSG